MSNHSMETTSSKKEKKPLVLVTGGAGFFGINLIRWLDKHGFATRSLDIVQFDYPDMNDKVDIITGDIRSKATVKKAMQKVDFVVHTAAALPLYSKEEIFSTDIGGVKNLLAEAHKAKVKRFVHISSTAVYGIPDHHPLFESDKLQGVGPYGISKIEAEKECAKYRKKGMVVSIIRPKSFVGPERLGVFALYYDWIRRGKNIPIVGWGKNRYQLLDVDDLSEAVRLCLTKSNKAVNDTFNIGAEVYTTMKEDFGAVLEHAGHGKRIIGTPAMPLIWVLRVLEFFRLSPLYKWVYETAPHDSFVSIDKAKKKLGYAPKYSNKDALIRNYEWYMAHYQEYENKSGVTHRVPWKQGILAFVRWFF